MELTLPQAFAIGERVWLRDGRSGLITRAVFNPLLFTWEYGLGAIPGTFPEAALLDEPLPPPEAPPQPPPEAPPLPPPELADFEVDLEAEVAGDFVTRGELDAALRTIAAGAAAQAALNAVEGRLSDSIQNVAALLAQARVELEGRIVEAVQASGVQELTAQFAAHESAVVSTLSEIQSRQENLDAEAQEQAGLSFLGVVGAVGAFIRNPFEWWIERATTKIISEVVDGLDR